MDLKDLFLTPFFLIIFYIIAYQIRPKLTNQFTKKYFIPALTLKFIGAISLGLIYAFYYGGGDTFQYYKQSKIVYNAFLDSPSVGLQLLFSNGKYNAELYPYSRQMYWFHAMPEFFVIKLAGFFSLFCANTYTVIALFFAWISFLGSWAMYNTFLRLYPHLFKTLAYGIFYLPSVFFWGSGLMKDSLTFGSLGLLFWAFYKTLIDKKISVLAIVIGLCSAWLLFIVKTYILLCFLPPALLWVFNENSARIKSKSVRLIVKPFFLAAGIALAILSTQLTEGDSKYDLDKIGERTKVNYEYLTEFVQTGSAYNIGSFDGNIRSMIAVAPQAIVVSLYRPFMWEVRNPFMFLSALEALVFLYLTLRLIIKSGLVKSIKLIISVPIVQFCIIFSLLFAFGVGTNSGNFGTLVRYKIPLMPFYLLGLFILKYEAEKNKLFKKRKKIFSIR